MANLINTTLTNQYEAALRMLLSCVEQCPDARWQETAAQMTYDQVAFHTLFFTDIYLGHTLEEAKQQDFHQQHADAFADYEEIGGGLQNAHYDKAFIVTYLEFCRDKSRHVVGAEVAADLDASPGFECLKFSRLEAHFYNIRHIQHHAGALALKLRIETQEGIPWVGTGGGSKP